MAAGTVTSLLADWRNGRKEALDSLTPLVYAELRKMAALWLAREANAGTLQPTALVHEAYMRLAAQDIDSVDSRAHFFAIASRLMRQILVEHARRQMTAKRGERARHFQFDENLTFAASRSAEVTALDDALSALESQDPRKARAIELRYFGGLELEEISRVMEISLSTVSRELRMAQAWLYREMARG